MTKEEYTIFYKVNYPVIKSFIRKYIKNSDKAIDIAQDAFSILWLKRENYNYVNVRAFLFKTAYRIMIDFIRREKKIEYLDNLNDLNYSHTEQYTDLEEILSNSLNKLPEIQSKVITMISEGYSYKEIKEITDLSKSQVEVYIHRARVSLKKYLGSIEDLI